MRGGGGSNRRLQVSRPPPHCHTHYKHHHRLILPITRNLSDLFVIICMYLIYCYIHNIQHITFRVEQKYISNYNLGTEKFDNCVDILPAYRTGVFPLEQQVAAGLTGGEVVAGGEEAVPLLVHADDALLLY